MTDYNHSTVEHIRKIFADNLGIILPILHKTIWHGCSVESPLQVKF